MMPLAAVPETAEHDGGSCRSDATGPRGVEQVFGPLPRIALLTCQPASERLAAARIKDSVEQQNLAIENQNLAIENHIMGMAFSDRTRRLFG